MSEHAILHIDMDAFFAAVEVLDNPALEGKPLLIGGDHPRSVVTTASYAARKYGCRSAMPMVVAKQLCPEALILPTRGSRYREISQQVFRIFEDYSPKIKPLSIDEAFIDITGSIRLMGPPAEIAMQIKERIKADVGITCSVGLAPNMLVAKMASDFNKPDGLTVVKPEEVEAWLAPQAVGRIWGIGKVAQDHLAKLNIKLIRDLQRADERLLTKVFGNEAASIKRKAYGIDTREVKNDREVKSISQEHTFEEDIADIEALKQRLFYQADQVSWRLRRQHLVAQGVQMKLRYGDFKTITRAHALPVATNQSQLIWEAGRELFEKWAGEGFRPVRLLGLGVTRLLDEDQKQSGLFEEEIDGQGAKLDAITDQIREKFGKKSIRRGGSK